MLTHGKSAMNKNQNACAVLSTGQNVLDMAETKKS